MDSDENLTDVAENKKGFLSLLFIIGLMISVLALLIFVKLADEIWENESIFFDQSVINYLHSYTGIFFHPLMITMTRIGSVIGDTVLSLLITAWLYFYKKDKSSIYFLIIVVGGGGLLNYLLKQIFHRARPLIDASVGAIGYSFPSGHSMGSICFYGLCIYMINDSKNSFLIKITANFICVGFIILIGMSRIYLNAHYPSDVVGGYLAGLIWLLLCIFSLKVLKFRKIRKEQIINEDLSF